MIPLRVALICGSVAEKSKTRIVLIELASDLEKLGYTCEILIASGDSASSFTIAVAVKKASIVVLGTPVYHGSYSGALKLDLDRLPGDAFKGKIVGLVSHGGGIRTCTQPAEHLRSIVRAMQGLAATAQVGSADVDFEPIDDGYALREPLVLSRIKALANELFALSTLRC